MIEVRDLSIGTKVRVRADALAAWLYEGQEGEVTGRPEGKFVPVRIGCDERAWFAEDELDLAADRG